MSIGIDIAYPDGNRCNWAKAKAAGVTFAWFRDAFSTVDDPTYENEAPRARAAGVKPGPYFFPDESVNAHPIEVQIAMFVENVKKHAQPGDLPAAFDVEYARGIAATGRTRTQLLMLIVLIATELRAGLGYWPVMYSSGRVVDGQDTDTLDATHTNVDLSPLKNCPFWDSRYITGYHAAPVLKQLDTLPDPPLPKFLGDAHNVDVRQTQGDTIGLSGFSNTVDINVHKTATYGETGERIKRFQQRLGMAEGMPGVFDDVMADAVEAFQRANGLTVTRAIDLDTWAMLCQRP